jgi:aminopeptidase YwaD
MKPYLKFIFLLSSYFLLPPSFSQDIKYARKVVDTLASPAMHGRGYVNNGDKIAAKYLVNEFKSFKLKNFEKDYFQNFTLSVITFPYAVKIESGSNKFVIGKDFIVRGGPWDLNGSYETFRFNNTMLTSKKLKRFSKTDLSNKVLIVDRNGFDKFKDGPNLIDAFTANSFKAKATIFIENDKLTAEISTQDDFGRISMLRNSTDSISKIIYLEIQNKFIPEYQTQNIIGYIPGTQYPDSFMVFSAHYDHLGQMGPDAYFPGANDNASGCAMLLNLAEYYSQHPQKYSIAFMAFGAEEAGLVGSKYYVHHPLFPLKQIKFLVNLDLLGTGDEGITVVNGAIYKTEFDELSRLNAQHNYLPQIKSRGKAANSDHYYFSENGVKCFFIYTLGGIKAYHDIYDKPETLPLTKFENVFRLLTDFTEYLQK